MTKREFLKAIAAGTMNDEVMAEAAKMIEAMDLSNEKMTRQNITRTGLSLTAILMRA